MKDPAPFILGVIFGMLVLPILRAIFRRKKHVPTVLGSSVPLAPHALDFSRRYNISAGSHYGEGAYKEFHSVRIVGYVEKQRDAGSKFYEDWIVAELPNRRKIYLTPSSIKFMEEDSDGPKKSVIDEL